MNGDNRTSLHYTFCTGFEADGNLNVREADFTPVIEFIMPSESFSVHNQS
jgi:hypothetical protein